jgi:signal transduction histidine kinase
MSLSTGFGQQPRGWIIVEMALGLLVIGVCDYLTSYQIRLLPFYGGPIFVVAWFCGARYGTLAALFSVVIWWCANWFNGDPDLHHWIQLWEVGRHIGFFLVVAWLGSALRSKSDIAVARIALLERSQRLEHEIVNISEAEQRRIGQDLHDGICQYLAALTCSASSLRDELRKSGLQGSAETAAELALRLQDAVVQTRDLARELIPAHVGQVGIAVALDALAQSVSRLHGIDCTFRGEGSAAKCDDQTAAHLYRVAQEAINNAARHGKAKHIAISLEADGKVMTLRIADDGIGISESASPGMGLAIMRYRARLSGGDLEIQKPASGGTVILCTAKTEREVAIA